MIFISFDGRSQPCLCSQDLSSLPSSSSVSSCRDQTINGRLLIFLMAYKISWMSLHASFHLCVNIFKTWRLQDRWAGLASIKLDTYILWVLTHNFQEAEVWILAPALHGATPNLSQLREMTHPNRGAYSRMYLHSLVGGTWLCCKT